MSDRTRNGLMLTSFEGQQAIDYRFRVLAKRIPRIIAEVVQDGPIEERHRNAISARIKRELDTIFPVARGADCLLASDIQLLTNRARTRGVKSAMSPVVKIAKRDPELAEAIDAHG
jgi:hypothetical protein